MTERDEAERDEADAPDGETAVEDAAPAPIDPRRRLRLVVRGVGQLVLGVGLFAGIVWWVAPPWSDIADRIHLSVGWLVVSLLGSLLATIVTAARWKLLSETMGASRLPYGVYFHYLALTRVIGQVLPTVLVDVLGRGAALKAAGSKSRLGQLIAPVVLERVLDLLLPMTLLGWALLVHFGPTTGPLAGIDPWVSLAVITVVFSLLSIPLLGPLVRLALRMYGLLRRLRHRELALPDAPTVTAPLAARIVVFSLGRFFGILVQYLGAGAGLGVLLSALTLVSAAPLAQLAGLVGITPGGLGMQEGGWAAALRALGEDQAAIVVFMAGTRLMMSVNFGILSLASWPWRRVRAGARSR